MNCKGDVEPEVSETGGKKFLEGKLQWSLFPFAAAEKIQEVIDYGAKKYEKNNWKKVPVEWFKDALMRHLKAYWSGEFYADDSKLSHLAHAACNLLFMIWKEQVEFGEPVNSNPLKRKGNIYNVNK